jgi:4-hydroxybenzoate polyprenyltransferase
LSAYARLVAFPPLDLRAAVRAAGAWLAERGMPRVRELGWIVVCAVAARTAAMAFNRLVDRRIDARNPRTQEPRAAGGVLTPLSVAVLVLAASTAFVLSAWMLNPLCAKLAPAVLAVLFFYSFTKRFTWLAHAFLGLSLGARAAGRVARDPREFGPGIELPLILSAAVLTGWRLRPDLCLPGRRVRPKCAPALGPGAFRGRTSAARGARAARAQPCSRSAGCGCAPSCRGIYLAAIVGSAALLWWEHSLVAPDDLSRVDVAFFTLNGWVGVALFAGLALDLRLVS